MGPGGLLDEPSVRPGSQVLDGEGLSRMCPRRHRRLPRAGTHGYVLVGRLGSPGHRDPVPSWAHQVWNWEGPRDLSVMCGRTPGIPQVIFLLENKEGVSSMGRNRKRIFRTWAEAEASYSESLKQE